MDGVNAKIKSATTSNFPTDGPLKSQPHLYTKPTQTTVMPSIERAGLLLLMLLAASLLVQGFVPAAKVPARQVSGLTGLDPRVQLTNRWHCVLPIHPPQRGCRRPVWCTALVCVEKSRNELLAVRLKACKH